MKKIFYPVLCWCTCSAVFAGDKTQVSSGGMVFPNGQVKIIGMGSPVAGRGRGPIVGLGLPYVGTKGKGKAGAAAHQSASVAGRVASSGISSEFVLGEVYVYPNPAKGGQVPTFHVEVGIADSVKITVYTVAGDVAHNYTITSQPSAINDGHGLEYAYEYAWRGHIPSGVYYYVIEAQKTGKKLRKTGKFAVVR